jgi:hypothetical protein
MSYKNITKVVLAAALFICIFHMPYGYYQLIRIIAPLGFGFLAYLGYKEKEKFTPILYVFCAILLNPVVKIYFKKQTWNIIDIILACLLLLSLVPFTNWSKKNNN